MNDNSWQVAAEREPIRITGLKAMELQESGGQSLVKIETDAGICGIGEAGASGPVVRSHLEVLEPLLIGQTPLAIDRHYDTMMSQMHPWRSHVPTVSGVDIALWDLAGRILGLPICELLTGKYRDQVTIYYSPLFTPGDALDLASCREWAETLFERAAGYTVFKCGGTAHGLPNHPSQNVQIAPMSNMLTQSEMDLVRRGHENIREALGFGVDIIFSEHGQFDLPTSIGLCQALETTKPLWMEDLLPIWCMDTWKRLKDASRVPVMLGEKTESTREFGPFITNGAVDAVHPDICFSGGITGCRRIAQLADQYYIPVATHCVGSMVQQIATAHFGASVRNFTMSETRIYARPMITEMCEDAIAVVGGKLQVPGKPGLGITLNDEYLRTHLIDGEPYWDA